MIEKIRQGKTGNRDNRLVGHWTTWELWFGFATALILLAMAVMW